MKIYWQVIKKKIAYKEDGYDGKHDVPKVLVQL